MNASSMGKWAVGGLAVAAGFALASLNTASNRSGDLALKMKKTKKTVRASVMINKKTAEVEAFFKDLGVSGIDVSPIHAGEMSLVTAARDMSELDLRQFKARLETGEVATIMGQSHGERSAVGKLLRSYDKAKSMTKNEASTVMKPQPRRAQA